MKLKQIAGLVCTIFNQFWKHLSIHEVMSFILNRMQLYQQKTKPTVDSFASHLSSGHITYHDHLILKTRSSFYIPTIIHKRKKNNNNNTYLQFTHDRSMCLPESCVIMVMHSYVYVQTTCSLFTVYIVSYRTIGPFKYEPKKKGKTEK